MSWRVEHADPLSLLRELPDNWVQTCVTSPPADADSQALAVLGEVHRVLREDGTLWLLLGRDEPSLAELREQGWTCQPLPLWGTSLVHGWCPPRRLLLLTTGHQYFYEDHALEGHIGPQSRLCLSTSRQTRRVQGCAFAPERRLQLVKRCILVGSSLLSCGVCGAPYRRARPSERVGGIRRPTCRHNDPEGSCLVLDPFCGPGALTAEAARRTGRNFLGITTRAGDA